MERRGDVNPSDRVTYGRDARAQPRARGNEMRRRELGRASLLLCWCCGDFAAVMPTVMLLFVTFFFKQK